MGISEKTSAGKWPFYAFITLGIVICGMQLGRLYVKDNPSYEVPNFDELHVSEGTAHFVPTWKSSGGELVLKTNERSNLIVTCNEPYSNLRSCGSYLTKSGDSLEKAIKNSHAKVWWFPDNDTVGLGGSRYVNVPKGRLYQLEVDNKMYYEYSDRKEYYIKRLKSFDETDVFPILANLAIFILFPLYKLCRSK